jgi:predicted small secreted protein
VSACKQKRLAAPFGFWFLKCTMKKLAFLFLALAAFSLSGCGTIGGALSGAGTDLTSAGNWVKEIGQ